jgi:hypothetical protein
MGPQHRSRVWGAAIQVLFLVLTCGARPARGEENIGGERAGLTPAARFAILRAREALANPECQRIFLDFQDSSGRALQDRLDALGSNGQRYLDSMLFYDVPEHPACGHPRILAMTTPGSRVVLFCGPKFSNLIRREPSSLWIAVLHEELHSLGLGENPPTSQEISRHVAERCR